MRIVGGKPVRGGEMVMCLRETTHSRQGEPGISVGRQIGWIDVERGRIGRQLGIDPNVVKQLITGLSTFNTSLETQLV